MVEEIIRKFDLAGQADVYVQFFLDTLLSFISKNSSGLSGFLEWWEKKKESKSVIVPEGINAVRVMTIHKSKGLEFPVVIYPFANSRVKKAKDKLWVDISKSKPDGLDVALVNTGQAIENTVFADLYTKEMNKSFLDLVNLVYVVMTRPSERLYILTETPPKSKDKIDSVPKFLHYYLVDKGLWNDDETVYRFGERVEKEEKEQEPDEDVLEFNTMISTPWRKRMLLSLKAPEYWDVAAPDSGTKYGTMIHAILSKIKTESDIETVLNDMEQEGIIEGAETDEIEDKIRSFLSKPSVGKYFKPGLNVKTEAEILLPDGKIIRPDRLILEDDKATVIDFKTGKPAESHKKQIRRYEEKMRELGFDDVTGVLLYLNEDSEG
jgi:ATP-dependent exoDNAse (exonuclease V) beta subunit